MKPVIEWDSVKVFHGSNLDVLPTLPDNSVDSIVTDPPYELGFMGKKWDSTGIAYSVELWTECMRVLKPGGHLLAFGGSRTWHRLAVAIEDAGFEVRDSIAWLYGSGFPKSHNVANAIDKKMGAANRGHAISSGNKFHPTTGEPRPSGEKLDKYQSRTPESEGWAGWGTALKPAFEPVVVARKPLIGTVAENVLAWGVGGLNIDGSRIQTDELKPYSPGVHRNSPSSFNDDGWQGKEEVKPAPSGRWPANVMLDEFTAGLLDEQSGVTTGKVGMTGKTGTTNSIYGNYAQSEVRTAGIGDKGGASRFFYVAKASKLDRNEGLDELPDTKWELQGHQGNKGADGIHNKAGHGTVAGFSKNFHPTVKPTDLMRYLVKLVTPPGGTVLDPFTGSGSTGKAAILEGFDFVGIELTDDYLPIIEGRLRHATDTRNAEVLLAEVETQEKLF